MSAVHFVPRFTTKRLPVCGARTKDHRSSDWKKVTCGSCLKRCRACEGQGIREMVGPGDDRCPRCKGSKMEPERKRDEALAELTRSRLKRLASKKAKPKKARAEAWTERTVTHELVETVQEQRDNGESEHRQSLHSFDHWELGEIVIGLRNRAAWHERDGRGFAAAKLRDLADKLNAAAHIRGEKA
jgi:hypothetical protein